MYSVKLTNSAGQQWFVDGFASYQEALAWLYKRVRAAGGHLSGKIV